MNTPHIDSHWAGTFYKPDGWICFKIGSVSWLLYTESWDIVYVLSSFRDWMPFVCEFPLSSQFHVAECERLWKLEHGCPWYVQCSPRLWCFCQRHRSQQQGCSKRKKLNLQSGDISWVFLVASWTFFSWTFILRARLQQDLKLISSYATFSQLAWVVPHHPALDLARGSGDFVGQMLWHSSLRSTELMEPLLDGRLPVIGNGLWCYST